ncbi:hypothetical protein BGZ97_005591 [Linnemannia gamsii]|uniref:F-box domain-containing protein n=1 Tax=Linnemannia gamsii TaxID=64522 RepID=A0A9P6UF56_9FUNG|nr:hypothetical protein BGZ97_005591 [Linnemannia gamsii]
MFWTCQPVKKRKDSDKLTKTNALAPCNRVLAIPELRDLLYSFFPSRLTTTTARTTNNDNNPRGASCMLVCRHWNSYFAPYHWSNISFTNQNHLDFAQVIRAQGYRVRKFSCSKVDKSILTTLVQHCHSLEELDLGFGEKTFWMQYDFLEQIFIDLAHTQQQQQQQRYIQYQEKAGYGGYGEDQGRHGLRRVEITLNMLELRPQMLWSLCQLPHLKELTINANGIIGDEESLKYLEDVTLYLLECCPGLESFTVHYNALTVHRHPFEYRNWLKEKVETEMTRGPMTFQDALARRKHVLPAAAPRWSGWPSEKQDYYYERPPPQYSAQEKPKTWNLRRLVLYGFKPDASILPRIFSRCPLLEDIGIHLGWSVVDASTWTSLATQCPNLKTLNISGQSHHYRDYDMLSIPELLATFPRLEILNVKDYPREDLDLQSLDSTLLTNAQEKGGEGERGHLLKSFSLQGHFSGSLAKILDVLSSRSFSQLEELKIESTFTNAWCQAQTATPNASTEGSLLDFTRSWDIVARTLVKLDLHGLQFPDKETTVKFLRRVQEFESLRVLRVSHHHLKDFIASTAPNELTAPSPSLNANAGDLLPIPPVDFRLPHIQELLVPKKWTNGLFGHDAAEVLCPSNGMLTLSEMLFLLVATPSLKTFSLARNSIQPETAALVRGMFRHVYLDTNHE